MDLIPANKSTLLDRRNHARILRNLIAMNNFESLIDLLIIMEHVLEPLRQKLASDYVNHFIGVMSVEILKDGDPLFELENDYTSMVKFIKNVKTLRTLSREDFISAGIEKTVVDNQIVASYKNMRHCDGVTYLTYNDDNYAFKDERMSLFTSNVLDQSDEKFEMLINNWSKNKTIRHSIVDA